MNRNFATLLALRRAFFHRGRPHVHRDASSCPCVLGLARRSASTPSSRNGRARSICCSARSSAVIDEPGLHFLMLKLGLQGADRELGSANATTLDLRLDQEYLRSPPVNSEEGAPMGIGIWYEMFISDPVAYLFKNADPRGSLAANVGNSTVRCLSNMKLADMLQNRHPMSLTVRKEVSPQSQEWGYRLGSVYIRKVHFRDAGMIKQIEEKVVNRLRQVTSAIKQDGTNQVNIIASTAEQQAAIEFAKAAAMRPQIVGRALKKSRRTRTSATRCSPCWKRRTSLPAKPTSRSSRATPNCSGRSWRARPHRRPFRPPFRRG